MSATRYALLAIASIAVLAACGSVSDHVSSPAPSATTQPAVPLFADHDAEAQQFAAAAGDTRTDTPYDRAVTSCAAIHGLLDVPPHYLNRPWSCKSVKPQCSGAALTYDPLGRLDKTAYESLRWGGCFS